MLTKLLHLVRTDTAKDATAMTVGTGLAALVAALFFIIVARRLTLEDLGIFSLATATSFMFADMVDIALNAALVRFVAASQRQDPELAKKYLKLIFKIKVGLAIALFAGVGLLASPLSKLLFGQAMPLVLRLTALGTGFQLLYMFGVAHLQARREFIKAAAAIVLLPTLRLLGLVTLILFMLGGPLPVLIIYFFLTPIAALVTVRLAPVDFVKVKAENEVGQQFLRFTLPLTLGFALAAVSARVDNFVLANLSSLSAVGIYAATYRLFTPVQFLAGSIASVFAPRFAVFAQHREARIYVGKAIIGITVLTLGMLAVFPASRLIILLFYGERYLPAVPILRILLFGFAAFLMQAPFSSIVLYYFKEPRVFTMISAIQLVVIAAANIILVPRLQAIGSAIAFLATQLLVLSLFAGYTVWRLRRIRG